MRRLIVWLSGALLAGCGGQVVAVKLPQDANASAHYTCSPEGKSAFTCRSEQTFNQYDRELLVSKQHCAYGVYRIYVETNWRGDVTRVQYTCASAPVGEFPTQ